MKTIGLIGGMSWESTVSYYQLINKTIKQELGGLHSAKIILYSVDFQEIENCQANNDWDKSARILTDVAEKLQQAGADFIVICTNTMHKVADQIQQNITIPIIHIAEVTAELLLKQKMTAVGLLGTCYTMEQDFYKNKLTDRGIKVLIPKLKEREMINKIIYQELCLGTILAQSKRYYLTVIDQLVAQGAQGIILGCTEIGLLIKQSDTTTPLFDTAEIHAQRVALMALVK